MRQNNNKKIIATLPIRKNQKNKLQLFLHTKQEFTIIAIQTHTIHDLTNLFTYILA